MVKSLLVKMKVALKCMFTPRLYKIYGVGPLESTYEPQGLQKWSDKVISMTNTLFNIGLYTSPFICLYVFRRETVSSDEARFLLRCFGSLSCLFAFCYFLRGIGRAFDPNYLAFVRALSLPHSEPQLFLQAIRCYDFDFYHWPVSFRVDTHAMVPWYQNYALRNCSENTMPMYRRIGLQILAYFSIHTFGLRLIYPGSVGLVHHLLSSAIFQGRSHLVENYQGQRSKIQTADLNTIDTMFIDNRPNHQTRGKILVICCEGNSGFYEIGLMNTPAKANYSVLGWNHPGFAESTGRPYPDQEHNAVDAVMQYAINELHFTPDNIVLYGWSIGGYAATWAAVNYPIRGLILDATFDDLLPLAENQMPSSWSRLVKEVIRSYVDLNIAEWLAKYSGPVQLIRRTDDEILSLRPGYLATNRGNQLLVKLVQKRHPSMNSNTRDELHRLVSLHESQRGSLVLTSVNEYQQRALRLISTYMRDFKSTHCTPLPEMQFQDAMEAIAKMTGQ